MTVNRKSKGEQDDEQGNEGQKYVVAEPKIDSQARALLAEQRPYAMRIDLIGMSGILFHAWDATPPDSKPTEPKGSKKSDDVESYVYRNADGHLGVPGYCFTGALAQAGKFIKDPRSARKSGFEIVRAAIVPVTDVASFAPKTQAWDYLDARRVTIKMAGITRVRPGMQRGWRLSFEVLVLIPEYFPPALVLHLANDAGRLVGLCDYRPVFGRFAIAGSEVLVP